MKRIDWNQLTLEDQKRALKRPQITPSDEIRKTVEDSLRRLKTDRLDLWQFHEMVYDNDPDWVFEKGGLNVLITDPRDTKGLISEMSRWPLTAMTGVNTLFHSLVKHHDFATLDFSTFKVVSAGGMDVEELARAIARLAAERAVAEPDELAATGGVS